MTDLGNVLLGNSRGEISIPRGKGWEEEFQRLWPVTGIDYQDEFENDTFWIFPYWWGDCTCGWNNVDDGHRSYQDLAHRAHCFHTKYRRIDDSFRGLSHVENWLAQMRILYSEYGFSTEGDDWWHGCAVKCTCDLEERRQVIIRQYAVIFGHEGHKSDCYLVKDNFHYNPTGFGIQWYKYPFRDSYMNQDISLDSFRKIIDNCIRSLRTKGTVPSDHLRGRKLKILSKESGK